jgi:hypothetical protein
MNGEPTQQGLCLLNGCRNLAGHTGACSRSPTEAWSFFLAKDKKKLGKAGFATPRGGAKGAYQNHVVRSCKVIIPFERLPTIDLTIYREGYVIRLFPEQYFADAGIPKPEFLLPNAPVRVGDNAFVLYRTHSSLENLPPMPNWQVRRLLLNGADVTKRKPGAVDVGHYVLRLSTTDGTRLERIEGPPQGIFAPEYSDSETNFLCKCVLAWLTIHTRGSPYTVMQAAHLSAILHQANLDDAAGYEFRNVLRHGLTCCPLCMKILHYRELHQTVGFEAEAGLENAAIQVEGSTRSTVVNLFHLEPLVYGALEHAPRHVAWGHALCNTRLGQRKCYSLPELQELDLKVGIIREENIETFGWISRDYKMIRSPNGAVWIQLNQDILQDEAVAEAEGPPPGTEEL